MGREAGDLHRHLRIAMLGLAFLPMSAALLLAAALVPEQDGQETSRRAWQTATAALHLAARQHRIESRLMGAASDPALGRLLDGVSGGAEQQIGARVLATLRGKDGPAVTAACLSRPSGATSATMADAAGGGAASAACPPASIVSRALVLPAGGVVREMLPGTDGSGRLLVSVPLRAGERRPYGVLSAQVALPELVSATADPTTGPTATLLVDASSQDVVVDGRTLMAMPPGTPTDLEVRVGGVLFGHADTISALQASGWAATSAPIPLAGDGPRLALITLWPALMTGPPLVLLAALGGLAAAVLATAVTLARRFQLPFEALARSQAQLEVMYAEAREDSLHDGLTGLGNHRAFQEELDRQMEIHRRHGVPVSLLLIDVDDLKVVNDREGHAAGDQLLQGMSDAIRDALRYGDRAFRIGGDEFAVILPHTDAAAARFPASRLLRLCLSPASDERRIAFSGGISAVPQPARDRDELYRQADAALYWCKRHGRASVEVFDPDRDLVEEAGDADAASAAVHETVRRRLLSPVFQPIIDLRSGAVLGFEGLVRPTPDAPFSGPGDLFVAAAASGRTVELDLACLEVVAQGARGIDPSRIMSVNLSPRTLEAHGFTPRWLLEHLGRHAIDPGRVIVEMTEREPLTDLPTFTRNVALLQRSGIRVAADDVGAGNAGLRLLSQVRFDVVKIDLSLVQDGTQRGSSQAVLRSLQDLAARQGAAVIAEGVETAAQLRVLRELGVPAAQGFLLGRPGTSLGTDAVDLGALESGTLFLGQMQSRPVLFVERVDGLEATPA